jgi:Crp-like helix-turn-helix domain
MYSVYTPSAIEDSLLRWQQICQWAMQNDRCQWYKKDAVVVCESGWIYFVQRGVVRLHGQPVGLGTSAAVQNLPKQSAEHAKDTVPSLLALVGSGQPFEVGREPHVRVQVKAHVRNTTVIRIHTTELSIVPGFEIDALQAIRYQHQRQTLRLHNLTQGRVIDQLLGYLHLLGEEFGEDDGRGLHLPFVLTHAQLAGAIGSTRVTITRLLGELRKYGEIKMSDGNRISLPLRKNPPLHLHLIE